jgi:hypothetical protein
VALGEEVHRQRHHVPQETADHDDRKLGLKAQQQRLLEGCDCGAKQCRRAHADE